MTQKPLPLPGLPGWVAHTPSKADPTRWHDLPEHILAVAELAADFAEDFEAAPLARYLGLLHDVGKFSRNFQRYLLDCYRADNKQGKRPEKGSAPHKQAGASLAVEDNVGDLGLGLSAVLHGHHGGMLGAGETGGTANKLEAWRLRVGEKNEADAAKLRDRAALVDARLFAPPPVVLPELLAKHCSRHEDAEIFLRFLFSCLVDADLLDTERHKNPDKANERNRTEPPSLRRLNALLRANQRRLRREAAKENKTAPNVRAVRAQVYAACLRAANRPPGVFTLTVPTGGGKTRSSLAFALAHAIRHDLRRVIYAVPYISITTQTARVFRDEVFKGVPGTVLEHHSGMEERREDQKQDVDDESASDDVADSALWRRLSAENWSGAPVIVTTTVQLIESLFSNRPARCRKLHNFANAVIVLDEVQALPPTLIQPIVSGLRTLVENFGATVVLCTATQPALSEPMKYLKGFDKARVTDIIPEAMRNAHFDKLRRVHYRLELSPWTWEQVAAEMRKESGGSCLCIVNTKRHALALMDALETDGKDENVFHLSTLLCGRHRRDVLKKIEERLRAEREKDGPPIYLVSTTVVEAGIDLNFPRGLRALAGHASIVQAAGRVNREGKRPRDESEVVVFKPADEGTPDSIYRMATEQTENWVRQRLELGELVDFDDPTAVTEFFRRLYERLGPGTGGEVEAMRDQWRFDEVAREIRLIQEDTVPCLITDFGGYPQFAEYAAEADDILNEVRERQKRGWGMNRELWARASDLCVSVSRSDLTRNLHLAKEIAPGLGLWVRQRGYDPVRGVTEDIIRDPFSSTV